MKKTKRCRGANPRPMALKASAFPLPHSDLQCFVQFINNIVAERTLKTTGRGAVLVRRWRSNQYVLGSRPASPFSFSDEGDAFISIISGVRVPPEFVFFTRRRRRLPPASAFSFSHVKCIGLIKNRPIVPPIDQKP